MSHSACKSAWLKYLLPAVLGALICGAASGQNRPKAESDLLDQVRRLEKVEADKIETDLRFTLKQVQEITNSNAAGAVELLKQALAKLESDTVLPQERRQALIRMVKDRIRVTELLSPETNAQGKQTSLNRRSRENDFRQQIKNIDRLQRDGQLEQAKRQADELAKRFPQESAAQALERVATGIDQTENTHRLNKQRERALIGGLQDVDRSSKLPGNDLEFPKDWKERTKDRSTSIKLTAKQKAILQALNTTVTVNFKNSRLEDVLEYLRTITGQTIALDPESLRDAEVSYDSPVTMSAKGVTVRTVLRKVLNDLGLSYVIEPELINVVSAQKAREKMVVRSYYVGDLLAGLNSIDTSRLPPAFQLRLPLNAAAVPQIQAAQLAQSVKELVEMVETSVDPQSWRSNGGSGTIFFHAPSLSLVVKQSAEVHAQLAGTGLAK
jgi:hypothetical protein